VWSALVHLLPGERSDDEAAAAAERLSGDLALMEREGKYMKYVNTVCAILAHRVRHPSRTAVEARLWRQLIVVANVFGIKLTETEKYGPALEMLRKAEELIADDEAMPSAIRKELTAFVADAFSFFYFRRGKYQAAVQQSNKALRLHTGLGQWDHVAKCHLHAAVIQSKQRKHDGAIATNNQVLQMVDDERLETGGASAQKICLVAVCYHNLAVERLAQHDPQQACVASQNARRLARLSLSYSNRYLKHFETTHAAALAALQNTKAVKQAMATNPEHAELLRQLSEDLYT
jgi:tetratricopeptide (TPR) repeat protein